MQEVFPVTPASGRALWFALIPFVFALPISAYIVSSALAPRNTRVVVSSAGLSIRGEYSLHVDRGDLDLASARPVDLTKPGPHELRVRTQGTGMPGYSAGWFKTGDNARAFVVVTDGRRVAYLPTRNGYSLLLSVADPTEFIARVGSIMASDAGRPLNPDGPVTHDSPNCFCRPNSRPARTEQLSRLRPFDGCLRWGGRVAYEPAEPESCRRCGRGWCEARAHRSPLLTPMM